MRINNWHFGTMIFFGLMTSPGITHAADFSMHIEVKRQHKPSESRHSSNGEVVVWLTPNTTPAPKLVPPSHHYTLSQKDKQFTPHILVIPTGSSVDFPNLDPFFHNVFSLFNGKRFDLGLYEAHTQRTVHFDRDGVSYIFCNIHPEMGAVIVTLSTPYYGVSSREGTVTLHDVPPGNYRLHVWAENVPLEQLDALGRDVEAGSENVDIGTISLETSGNVMTHHKNKFGESYAPASKDPY
ncbi:MAG TPA: hypothetical protein VHZ52_04370 [Acidobacteriaceae bacterium]|jgi:plastocyanin|nr:hypothetical protein [Acidobacteriaceae bacterium]